jgi:hypothetical protein
LYENDCIFDKFEAEFSGDGKRIMTGSYHNLFHVMDIDGSNDVWPLCSWRTPAITVSHKPQGGGGRGLVRDFVEGEFCAARRIIGARCSFR